MLKILLAEDHGVVREGIKKILNQSFGACAVTEAATGPQALAEFDKATFDIVLLDIGLPGRSGLEVLREMKSRKPDARVLVLSALAETELGRRVIKTGGAGFLAKESSAEELVRAIRKVMGGGRYISSNLAEHLAVAITARDGPAHEILSDREYEVFRMIGAGETVTQIARGLCISPKTVTTYRAQILRKMNMTNNAEIIRYALKNGIVA